jgi:hypothetical protein
VHSAPGAAWPYKKGGPWKQGLTAVLLTCLRSSWLAGPWHPRGPASASRRIPTTTWRQRLSTRGGSVPRTRLPAAAGLAFDWNQVKSSQFLFH